jgi:hypothetical protein
MSVEFGYNYISFDVMPHADCMIAVLFVRILAILFHDIQHDVS